MGRYKMKTYYLAIDIGASSGRHILGHLENGKMAESYQTFQKVLNTEPEYTPALISMASYYDKNGEDKLIKDIFKNVENQKRQGKLTNEQILQFVKNVSPMLNDNQKKRLNDLVNDLLKI